MHALNDFFTTDYGLMSAAVIAFVMLMAAYFVAYVRRHVRQDVAAEAARQAEAARARRAVAGARG